MKLRKISLWTEDHKPETEINKAFDIINKYKADKQSKIYTKISVNDLEEREGALYYDGSKLYRVYRYRNKLYKQEFTEM